MAVATASFSTPASPSNIAAARVLAIEPIFFVIARIDALFPRIDISMRAADSAFITVPDA
ncbi:hypothetical protein MMG94_19680 (plasmid) [Methylocystis parvus OBBP]|uniref:hypothetical protein n=1 Tax=Methylocystis parvus TaxID=134 RepID=UPI00035E5E04|nr:hypothetical protein [Methylocystis parvus]WBK02379.1 hypothetical protein MMG94_19680 [Methylocystis parvus OBBP]